MTPSSFLNISLTLAGLALMYGVGTAGNQDASHPDLLRELRFGSDQIRDTSQAPGAITSHEVELGGDVESKRSWGRFNGATSYLTMPSTPAPLSEFSVSSLIYIDDEASAGGDIISKFDAKARRGFSLSVLNHSGVAGSQPNLRTLHFGIDSGKDEPKWRREGKIGHATGVMSLAVFDGDLYAGTFDLSSEKGGRVYRYVSTDRWEEVDFPASADTVSALSATPDHLCAGTSRSIWGSQIYDHGQGSTIEGGDIYCRKAGTKEWRSVGRPDRGLRLGGDSFPVVGPSVGSLAFFHDQLCASPVYQWGVYCRDITKKSEWQYIGTPFHPDLENPLTRVLALGVWRGSLFAALNDSGGVARYEKETQWTNLGLSTLQNYSFAIYRDRLHVGTFSSGEVFVLEDGGKWRTLGQVGTENEVMVLMPYNGMLYAGSIPNGQVYRLTGDEKWELLSGLDQTAMHVGNVAEGFRGGLKRVSSAAIYQGRLFMGTMPEGAVYSFEAGQNVTYDKSLSPGWHHIAGVRERDRLKLYLDGKLVAESLSPPGEPLAIENSTPITIGRGMGDLFRGKMSRVRLFGTALTAQEIEERAGKALKRITAG